jgi:fibronectin type 3 domain-containing protein
LATAFSSQEIDLSWSPPANTEGLSQYLILAGTSPSTLQQIAVSPATQTTYKNLNLVPGTSYYYGIVAVEQGLDAPMTPVAQATTLPLPNPPTKVAGTAVPTSIVLTWQESRPPNGLPINYYEIWEGTKPGQLSQVAQKSDTTYTASSLTANTTYYFEIVAVDAGHDDSAPSSPVAVTTLALPATPVNVLATANSTTQVTVTWSESIPPNGLPLRSYNILRGTSPSGLTQVAVRTTAPFIDHGVTAHASYYYAIEAVDTSGDLSARSATVEVTTPN